MTHITFTAIHPDEVTGALIEWIEQDIHPNEIVPGIISRLQERRFDMAFCCFNTTTKKMMSVATCTYADQSSLSISFITGNGHGSGTMLLMYIEEWCVSQNISTIWLVGLNDAFFDAVGYDTDEQGLRVRNVSSSRTLSVKEQQYIVPYRLAAYQDIRHVIV